MKVGKKKRLKATTFTSLKGQFLLALPSVETSIFTHSITYICDHNTNGAMGIIINQPLDITLGDVFDQMSLTACNTYRSKLVLAGGPVNAQQGLVLHRSEGAWQSSMAIGDDIYLTASKDIIEAMADNNAPNNAQLALGYAGWQQGQLEDELTKNYWLTMHADASIIFDIPPEERWQAATQKLGIDPSLISPTIGHA